MADDWQLAGTPDTWKYKDEGDEVQGIYYSKEENVGPNGSNMYYLELEDGEIQGVWGSAVLDSRMKGIQPGEQVRIVFRGMIKTKGNREAKAFDVYHRKAPMTQVKDPADEF